MKKVLVVMGSDSDLKVMEKCVDRLKSFDIPTEVRICSAHRTPATAEQLAKNAAAEGFGVIIAAAGKAAHLGGVLAAYTTLPVIGVPMATSVMGGISSARCFSVNKRASFRTTPRTMGSNGCRTKTKSVLSLSSR